MAIFSKKQKITETKTFSEIPGFSFEYPVFKDWEINSIEKVNNEEYIVYLNYPENIAFEVAPQIKINKIDNYQREPGMIDDPISFEIKKNQRGFSYGEPGDGSLEFYADNFRIKIEPFSHEGNGYSGKVFVQKIIETFKFNTTVSESIKPVPLKELLVQKTTATLQELYTTEAAYEIIKSLEDQKENPDDFYATVEMYKKSGPDGYSITFHLWYKDDLNYKGKGSNLKVNLGSISGKSRDMTYTNQKKIIKESFWQ